MNTTNDPKLEPDHSFDVLPSQQPETNGSLEDLANLRLDQNFAAALNLATPLTTIRVGKPGKAAFFRVHPDEGFRLPTAVIELRDEGEVYLVDRKLWPSLSQEPTFTLKMILTCLSRPGDILFLWPIKMPDSDGRIDSWNRSAWEIGLHVATKNWVRIQSDRQLGAYRSLVAPASSAWGEPAWPSISFNEIVKIAFKEKYIGDVNHPVLRRLRGEV